MDSKGFQSVRNMNPFMETAMMTPGGSQANIYASNMRTSSGVKGMYPANPGNGKQMLHNYETEGAQGRGFKSK